MSFHIDAVSASVAILVIGVSYLLHSCIIYPFYLSPICKLPGPPVKNPANLMGHTSELGENDPGSAYLAWSLKYGSVSKHYRMFNTPCVTLTSPSGIKRVLATHNHLYARSSVAYKLVRTWFGPGLALVHGDVHKRQRAIATPAFTQKNLIRYIPNFITSAQELRTYWRDKFLSNTESNPKPSSLNIQLDIGFEMAKPTLDIIGRCGFGYEFNSVANGTTDVYSWILDLNRQFEFQHAVMDELFPISKWIFPKVWERHARANRAKQLFCEFGRGLISSRKQELIATMEEMQQQQQQNSNATDFDKVQDLFTLLLKANMDVDAKRTLKEDELLAQILVFVFAGHETSATALTFTLDFLANHPQVQSKLRAELLEVMPDSDNDPTTEYITSTTTYLDAVVKESLRLVPPIPLINRTALQDDIIDGHCIPKGTFVGMSAYAMNRLPEFWGTDASEFNPDRWLLPLQQQQHNNNNNPESKAQGTAFFTFSTGVQNCIGQRFAEWEIKSLLSVLVREFEFSPVEGFTYTKTSGAVQKPDPKLLLNVRLV
ncbi:cytochrome P450 [Obelidium mucronatum]|nr:cytochrome P450 [Obelidium mucronatum]